MSQADIYDFEGVFEGACKKLLEDADITAFTSRDAFDFQKDRPRVEIIFTLGPGRLQRPFIQTGDDQNPTDEREAAWQAKLQFELLTEADGGDHASYLVRLRYLLSTLRNRLNGSYLTNHSIGFVRDSGEQRTINPQEGYLKTVLVRDIEFSVQATAWPLLSQQS